MQYQAKKSGLISQPILDQPLDKLFRADEFDEHDKINLSLICLPEITWSYTNPTNKQVNKSVADNSIPLQSANFKDNKAIYILQAENPNKLQAFDCTLWLIQAKMPLLTKLSFCSPDDIKFQIGESANSQT